MRNHRINVNAGRVGSWFGAAFVMMIAALLAGCLEQSPSANAPGNQDVGQGGGQQAIEGPDGLAGMPADVKWEDTSPAWDEAMDDGGGGGGAGQKLLLTGIIHQPDGRTPAPNVVMYYYHTNTAGRYAQKPGHPRNMTPNELGQTHGYLRGWVKTGADGRYAIRTIRPGAYPTNDEVAHVHATIKEPARTEYYIDDFIFDDDPLLTTAKRLRLENRCGSGVLRLVKKDGVLVGERNIILGQNIPGYAGAGDAGRAGGAAGGGAHSGKKVGEDVFSFTPLHAWGPDKGTRVCPVCKYGWYHGILYFVGNNPDWADIKVWLTFLEAESGKRKDRLAVYFVYGNAAGYRETERTQELETLGRELDLKRVALTHVPSFADEASDMRLNRIDPAVGNTFILYKRSRIIAKAVDLKADAAGFRWIEERLEESKNEYFDLPKGGKAEGASE